MRCSDCGSDVLAESKFCPQCGTAVYEGAEPVTTTPAPEKASLKSVAGRTALAALTIPFVMILAFIFIIILGFFVFQFQLN
ncbi:MAG: zinc-ribbon domain-containing protein [Coriobacteriia bacterium]|nr:zinc-ribbon domain-containing protein [Coriobacteriia bacterium]